jgi:MFS family permease
VPLVLFGLAAPDWAVVASYGIALACLGFLNPVWETVVQQEVPVEMLARVSAYDWLVSLGAMPLGYVLGPVLAARFGYAWPLGGAAVLVVVSLAVPVSLPDVRNLRLRPAPEVVGAAGGQPGPLGDGPAVDPEVDGPALRPAGR